VAKRLDGSRRNLARTEAGLGPGHIVLDGDSAPLPQRSTARSQFSAHVCCGQTAGWIKMPLSKRRFQPRQHCVRCGPRSLPQFSAHVYCGQTAGWIKRPLGMELGLSPDHIVLDGDQLPPQRGGAEPPIFGPCLLWPNGGPSQLLLITC